MIAIIWAVPVFAHHGPGTFELAKSVTFKDAKLTKVELLNPHGWLYFEVTRDGKVERHRCEIRSAHVLRRSGWTDDLLKPNQKMTVEASPTGPIHDRAICRRSSSRMATGWIVTGNTSRTTRALFRKFVDHW
jgi:hypothetical protein